MSGKKQLFDLAVDEVSLVDDPANDESRVVIVKMKGDKFEPCKDCSGSTAPTCKKNGACISKQRGGDAMRAFAKRLAEVAAEFSPQMVEKMFGGSNPDDVEAASSAAVFLQEIVMDIETLSKALTAADEKLDALQKSLDTSAARVAELEGVVKAKDAEIANLSESVKKGKTSEEQTAEFLKGLPEGVFKSFEESQAAAKAATEQVAKMQAERDEREAVEKAKTIGLGDAKIVGPLLMRVAKGLTTADDAKALEGILKAAAEQVAKGNLFSSNGSSAAVDGDPEELLLAKAKELKDASGGKLTDAEAYTKALEANPHLYTAYVAKRRHGAAAH